MRDGVKLMADAIRKENEERENELKKKAEHITNTDVVTAQFSKTEDTETPSERAGNNDTEDND